MKFHRPLFFSLSFVTLVGAGCQPTASTERPATAAAAAANSSCQTFTDLHAALRSPETVCVLNVSGQKRTGALPAEIRHFTNLRTLDASRNDMTGIPAEIGQLNQLRELDYGSNAIDTMPDEIANLQNLEILSLANNKYREVPASVLKLTRLRALDLTGDPLSAAEIARVKKLLPTTNVKF